MSRFLDKKGPRHRDNDNDVITYKSEKETLIDNDELDTGSDFDLMSDNINNLTPRKRQNGNIPVKRENPSHEMRVLKTPVDILYEPVQEFTFYDIQAGDTLYNICLRYSCPIDLVKRLNGLINEQDFYALKKLKLPLGKLALLEDILSSEQAQRNQIVVAESPNTFSIAQNNRTSNVVVSPGSAHLVHQSGNSSLNNNEAGITSQPYPAQISTVDPLTNQHLSLFQKHQHSHSFPNIEILNKATDNANTNIRMVQESFYISESDEDNHDELFHTDESYLDMAPIEQGRKRVSKVFENLDQHVERAKSAAELYDQKASVIVSELSNGHHNLFTSSFTRHSNVNRRRNWLPELFTCDENFGLNSKKLLLCIFIICIFIPLALLINGLNVSNLPTEHDY